MTYLYEAMFLLDNREVKKGLEQARDRITTLLTKHGAAPRIVRKWDERKLTYDIKKQKRATYMLAYFDAPSTAPAKIEHEAQLTEAILRCMILRTDSVPAKVMEEPWDATIAPQIEEILPPVEPALDGIPEVVPGRDALDEVEE
ncbi:MAG: 30S ribosomal protein S6 [Planctomycetes bacterium]|nr:30S ribosomal protein S6 [Planctomycetota bacterium]